MSVEEVLAELRSRGVHIRVDGDRLRIEARRGTITTELHQAIVVHKAALLARLASAQGRIITCPGDDCSERIELVDGHGWCPKHKMTIVVRDGVIH